MNTDETRMKQVACVLARTNHSSRSRDGMVRASAYPIPAVSPFQGVRDSYGDRSQGVALVVLHKCLLFFAFWTEG